jgi:asparagine synthase (glutamine-hydrolysing)
MLDRLGTAALPLLDGMFALAWTTDDETLHLARDTFGEVPLHYGMTRSGALVWASEVSALIALGVVPRSVRWLPPGHVLTSTDDGTTTLSRWADPVDISPAGGSAQELRSLLEEAVMSRMTSDVPVAVLLSGGLDSSIVTALLVKLGYEVHPYLAVHYRKAADVTHARRTAADLGLRLTEVHVQEPTASDLRAAVEACEMPHKAQVEITLACLPLAHRLAVDGFKVVLSGEGSDELWASYGTAYHGIKKHGWGPFRCDLFTGQHRKNFPRVNKVFMAHGVEARMPFLHPALARYALRLDQRTVTENGRHPKAVLARAADGLLSEASAWRAKAAFQTQARLDVAAARAVAAPTAFYRAEFRRAFRGVEP